jgi:hypothetical protein
MDGPFLLGGGTMKLGEVRLPLAPEARTPGTEHREPRDGNGERRRDDGERARDGCRPSTERGGQQRCQTDGRRAEVRSA